MRCLYCGKEIALFKRLRGGEFCSDSHRQRYQEEYTQLALNRLLQANPKDSPESNDSKEKDAKPLPVKTANGVNGKEPKPEKRPDTTKPAELESPALKRRERLKIDEAPKQTLLPAARIHEVPSRAEAMPEAALPAPVASVMIEEPPPARALPEPEPELIEIAPEPVFVAVAAPEPPSPPMCELLIEVPVPVMADVVDICKPPNDYAASVQTLLPAAQPAPHGIERSPSLGGRVDSLLPGEVDWLAPRQRALDIRDFVRSAPVVQIPLKPVGEMDLPSFEEPLEITLEPHPVDLAPSLSLEPVRDFPPLAVLFQELARADFEPTAWGESAAAEAETLSPEALAAPAAEPPSAQNVPAAIEASRLEPVRRMEPVHFESARPRPFHFEPVQVDPVLVGRSPAKSELASNLAPAAASDLASDPASAVAEPAVPTDAPQPEAAPAEPPALQIPDAVTRPEPVTLHGIAPARGKLVQVFASALPREADIQTPPQSSLPLRPVMVFGPAVAPPAEAKAPAAPEKVEAQKVEPQKVEPQRVDAPKPEPQKPAALPRRKTEVRVLSVPAKNAAPAKPELKAPDAVKIDAVKVEAVKTETPKPELVKTEAAKPQPVKAEASKPEASKPESKATEAKAEPTAEPKPIEAAKPEPAKPVAVKAKEAQKEAPKDAAPAAKDSPRKDDPRKEDLRKSAAQADSDTPYRPAPVNAASPIPDLLGLPTLSLDKASGPWARIPMMVRVGIAAGVLALAGGAIFLTSRGSSAVTPAPVAKGKPLPNVVEGPALASNAGWAQDWFADGRGAKTSRHVDVLRGSLTLRDYKVELEGQIDQGAIGWAFRANNKSFYAEKVAIVKAGLEPTIALVRIAVIDGQEVTRDQIPLPLKVHLDTQYKVRLEAVGSRFITWVQDQQVDDWTDARIEAGGVGLYYDGGDSAHLKGTLNVVPLKEK